MNAEKLFEILLTDNVVQEMRVNKNYLFDLIPELKFMVGFKIENSIDLWNHTLAAIGLSEKNFDIRLSLLLHNIGKPFLNKDNNKTQALTIEMVKNILDRFDFNDKYIENIVYLVKNSDKPINNIQLKTNYHQCLKLYEIQKCDIYANETEKNSKEKKYLDTIYKKMMIKSNMKKRVG